MAYWTGRIDARAKLEYPPENYTYNETQTWILSDTPPKPQGTSLNDPEMIYDATWTAKGGGTYTYEKLSTKDEYVWTIETPEIPVKFRIGPSGGDRWHVVQYDARAHVMGIHTKNTYTVGNKTTVKESDLEAFELSLVTAGMNGMKGTDGIDEPVTYPIVRLTGNRTTELRVGMPGWIPETIRGWFPGAFKEALIAKTLVPIPDGTYKKPSNVNGDFECYWQFFRKP